MIGWTVISHSTNSGLLIGDCYSINKLSFFYYPHALHWKSARTMPRVIFGAIIYHKVPINPSLDIYAALCEEIRIGNLAYIKRSGECPPC